MVVKFDEDNFSIKLYRDFVKGKLVGLMEVIPIDELLEVWADHKTEPSDSEKPNNCEECEHWEYDAKYKWWHCPLQDNGMYECNYEPKDEPQIIKVGMATDSVTGKVLGITADTDCAWK